MIHITEKTKIKQGRGLGTGADYKPWIKCREINSSGTCVLAPDWKNGRMMQFLSQGEYMLYLILRWNDNVLDIREQFPLDKNKTMKIARAKAFSHPRNVDDNTVMTTDLLVTYRDAKGQQKLKAYSLKNRRSDVFGDITDPTVLRNVEKMRIEMAYWHLEGAEYMNVFKEELNEVFASNIKLVTQRYTLPGIFTSSDLLRYMIARKIIITEMEKTYIQDRMDELLSEYAEPIHKLGYKIVNSVPGYSYEQEKKCMTDG